MEMIALESLNVNPQELESAINKIESTGKVCRSDIEPYIQHFPVTVGLHQFTEEPSAMGTGIALEGMAAMFSAWVTTSQGLQIKNALERISGAIPKLSTAEVNAREAKVVAAEIVNKAPVLQLIKKDEEMGRVTTKALLGILGDSVSVDDQGGTISYKDAITAVVDAYDLSLRGGCTGVTNLLLTNGHISVTRRLSKHARELSHDLGVRAKKVLDIIVDCDELLASKSAIQLAEEIQQATESNRREDLLYMVQSSYDAILPPNKLVARHLANGTEDTSQVLSTAIQNLINFYAELQAKAFDPGLISDTTDVLLSADRQKDAFTLMKQRLSEINFKASELDAVVSILTDFDRDSKAAAFPPEIGNALNDFLTSLIADVETVAGLVEIFQTEAVTQYIYVDRFAEAQRDVIDTAGVFVRDGEEPFIDSQYKETFFKFLKKADKGEMVAESIGVLIGVAVGASLVAILGAAWYFIKKMSGRTVKTPKIAAVKKMEMFSDKVSELFKELSVGKHGQDITDGLYQAAKQNNAPLVAEAIRTGAIDFVNTDRAKRLTVAESLILFGKYEYLTDAIMPKFHTVIDALNKFCENGLLPAIQKLHRDGSATPESLGIEKAAEQFVRAADLERYQEAKEKWSKAHGFRIELGMDGAMTEIQKVLEIEVTGDIRGTEAFDPAGISARNYNDLTYVANALHSLNTTFNNAESRLKRSGGSAALNPESVAVLKGTITGMRKATEQLDATLAVINKEVNWYNNVGEYKSTVIKDAIRGLNRVAESCIVRGSTLSGSDVDIMNSRYNGLVNHIKQTMNKAKSGWTLESVDEDGNWTDVDDEFEDLAALNEPDEEIVTESLTTVAKIAIGAGIVAILGGIVFVVMRMAGRKTSSNQKAGEAAFRLKMAADKISAEAQAAEFDRMLNQELENLKATLNRGSATPKEPNPIKDVVGGVRLDKSPSTASLDEQIAELGELGKKFRSQPSVGGGLQGREAVEDLNFTPTDYIADKILRGEWTWLSDSVLPELTATVEASIKRVRENMALVERIAEGKEKDIDAAIKKMGNHEDSLLMDEEGSGKVTDSARARSWRTFKLSGTKFEHALYAVEKDSGVKRGDGEFLKDWFDRVVSTPSANTSGISLSDAKTAKGRDERAIAHLDACLHRTGQVVEDINKLKEKLTGNELLRGHVSRLKANLEILKWEFVSLDDIIDIIEAESKAADRANQIIGRTSSRYLRDVLKRIRVTRYLLTDNMSSRGFVKLMEDKENQIIDVFAGIQKS